jgi:hypothetical protein
MGSRLNDGAGTSVACDVQGREDDVVRPAVHPFDDGVSRACRP